MVKSSSQHDILLQYSVLTVNDQPLCVVGVGWGWDTFSAVGLGGEKVAETVLVLLGSVRRQC